MLTRPRSLILALSLAAFAHAAPPVASYYFNGTLNAKEAGVPALGLIDPLNLSSYATESVFGQSRVVLDIGGVASPPSSQGGLDIPASSLLANDTYSVEMVFQFLDRAQNWRRILDVQNRQSDSGFYVDPSNHLDIYPIVGSTAAWTNSVYHHVVLTISSGFARSYLDGVPQFNQPTALMNLNTGVDMIAFADNVAAGGQGEWSASHIALLRLYAVPLTDAEVVNLAADPFTNSPGCRADFNDDGFVDFFDFNDFVTCFEGGSCPAGKSADYNNDGFADFFDFNDFITDFETGC